MGIKARFTWFHQQGDFYVPHEVLSSHPEEFLSFILQSLYQNLAQGNYISILSPR